MTSAEPPDAPARTTAERNEADLERGGADGDGLARAVDRHRDELGMPPEPADGEDAASGADVDGPA